MEDPAARSKPSHVPLVIGISLPFLLIVIVMLLVYVPSMFVRPAYDFLYTTTIYDYRGCETLAGTDTSLAPDRGGNCTYTTYSAENGQVVERIVRNSYESRAQELYLYDVDRDSARKVTYEEVSKLTLNTESRSPDGFSIERKYGHSGIFEIFGGGYNERSWVLKKGIASKTLSVPNSDAYYYGGDDMRFLGWVIEQ